MGTKTHALSNQLPTSEFQTLGAKNVVVIVLVLGAGVALAAVIVIIMDCCDTEPIFWQNKHSVRYNHRPVTHMIIYT